MSNLDSDAWQEANAQFAEDDETEVVRIEEEKIRESQPENDEAADESSENPK